MLDELPLAEWLDRARAEHERIDRLIAWLEAGAEFAAQDEVPAQPPQAKPAARPARSGPRDIEGKVLGAIIRANRSLSRDEIAQASGVPKKEFGKRLQELVKAGRVVAEGGGSRDRRYRAAPREFHTAHRARTEAGKGDPAEESAKVTRVGLRARVMNAIAAHPDVTEVRIAELIGTDRDDVAEATGWLLERDRVHLNPDGTYRRNGAKEMAA